jgi:DNA primase
MPGHIPEEIIEQIRSRADIAEVIGSYVQLKRAGTNRFKGLCPFHNEKTPSFNVSVDKQMFHCFGCKKGGNVFTFVMEREGVDFPTAARMLADKYSIPLPEEQPWKPARQSEAGTQHAKISKERLYKLNEETAAFFERELRGNPNSPVAKYLETRALPKKTIEKFRLGAAPDQWTALLDFCKSKGFAEHEVIAAGLAKKHEEKKSVYDLFRNRLMFPVWDVQERVVGFSGRVVSKDSFGGKYVNTPETWIFNKSRLLYPFPKAREAIRDKKQAVLCEGQMDAIAFHRAGVENALAPLGTAFTDEQATMLKHHTNAIVVAFDSDVAGRKAMFKAAEKLLPKGIWVQAAPMPQGADPDSIFNEKGPDGLQKLVDNALDFFDFAFTILAEQYDANTPEGKAKISDTLVKIIALHPSETYRGEQTTTLAQRLELPPNAVLNELNKHRQYDNFRSGHSALSPNEAPPDKTIETTEGTYPKHILTAEAHLLELALAHGTFATEIAEKLPGDRITKSPLGKALELVIATTLNGEWEIAEDELKKNTLLVADPHISKVLATPEFEDQDPEKQHEKQKKALDDTLNSLNRHYDEQERGELQKRWETAQGDERTAILTRFQELSRKPNALARKTPKKGENDSLNDITSSTDPTDAPTGEKISTEPAPPPAPTDSTPIITAETPPIDDINAELDEHAILENEEPRESF